MGKVTWLEEFEYEGQMVYRDLWEDDRGGWRRLKGLEEVVRRRAEAENEGCSSQGYLLIACVLATLVKSLWLLNMNYARFVVLTLNRLTVTQPGTTDDNSIRSQRQLGATNEKVYDDIRPPPMRARICSYTLSGSSTTRQQPDNTSDLQKRIPCRSYMLAAFKAILMRAVAKIFVVVYITMD